MNNYFIISFSVLILFGITLPAGHAAENKKITPQIEMLDDAVMERLVESEAPSEQSQLLASLAGTWYYELKYWTKEGAEPQISTGTATNEMALGGKYLLSKTSVILNIGGQNIPYEGLGMLGYDEAKKSYVSIWADTLHTGVIAGNGSYNETLNAIEEKGTFKNPLDTKERSYRSVLQFTDDGTYKRTFFIADKSGKEFQVIEISFERR